MYHSFPGEKIQRVSLKARTRGFAGDSALDRGDFRGSVEEEMTWQTTGIVARKGLGGWSLVPVASGYQMLLRGEVK